MNIKLMTLFYVNYNELLTVMASKTHKRYIKQHTNTFLHVFFIFLNEVFKWLFIYYFTNLKVT